MHIEQVAGQVANHAVRVVGMEDHLDHMPDRPLNQRDQLCRGSLGQYAADRLDDRSRFDRPGSALVVTEKAPGAQSRVDLRSEFVKRHGNSAGCSPARHFVVRESRNGK